MRTSIHATFATLIPKEQSSPVHMPNLGSSGFESAPVVGGSTWMRRRSFLIVVDAKLGDVTDERTAYIHVLELSTRVPTYL